eukprot:TRINITY_DN1370_c0_g1_i1.p1 TRINITY_DN1370_c0_g1~~TRINITY_DN1370_c0_g1_i1.p1  ORF type:complete len:541 (+),score=222.52 TRINITY_DN1370_c0_g1_i1:137-1759(+)
MVVLAAAIVSLSHSAQGRQNCKTLMSRQYVDMSRIRIEGLLAAFPKLMPSGKQHTFIETEKVRYVYQPFENMTLVLVTNRGSNIVDDLETLRLLGRLLPEIVVPGPDKGQGPMRTEAEVVASTFDIMFAFDEVITSGYRNNVQVDNVLSCLQMESYEEEVHRMVQLNKVRDAKRLAKEEASRIRKMKKEQARYESVPTERFSVEQPSPSASPRVLQTESPKQAAAPAAAPRRTGGLSLKSKKKDIADQVAAEEGRPASSPPPGRPGGAARKPPSAVDLSGGPAYEVKEHVSVAFDNDGNVVEAPKLKGSMALIVPCAEFGFFEVQLPQKLDRRNFDLRPHPNLDPKVFEESGLLRFKEDKKKPFPLGQAAQILKWGLKPAGRFELPLVVSVWGDEDNVLVQYELKDEAAVYTDVVVVIPCGEATPNIDSADVGTYVFDPARQAVQWVIERIDKSQTQAGLNITWSTAVDVADVSPIQVELDSVTPLAGVRVQDVCAVGQGAKWMRRRLAVCSMARRASTLGRVRAQRGGEEAIRNIVSFI